MASDDPSSRFERFGFKWRSFKLSDLGHAHLHWAERWCVIEVRNRITMPGLGYRRANTYGMGASIGSPTLPGMVNSFYSISYLKCPPAFIFHPIASPIPMSRLQACGSGHPWAHGAAHELAQLCTDPFTALPAIPICVT